MGAVSGRSNLHFCSASATTQLEDLEFLAKGKTWKKSVDWGRFQRKVEKRPRIFLDRRRF